MARTADCDKASAVFCDSYTATALIYPAAYYTVLRSALMGATQALLVLQLRRAYLKNGLS
ncbi:hypothetical protein Lfu02_76380 [Longispora fulva]|nr:hypothetical protein Lfu02_76380 [Longispora fulva]